MRLTLFNVSNTERFYQVLECCSGPVMVSAAGRCEDIRGNLFLHTLLSQSSGSSGIARLELDVRAERDVPAICRFMMEGSA